MNFAQPPRNKYRKIAIGISLVIVFACSKYMPVLPVHSEEITTGTPATTPFHSVADLIKQNKSLFATIENLLSLTPVTRPGAKGADIKALQQSLASVLGKNVVAPTGVFDDATKKAVSDFQRQAGLVVTGAFDGPTRRALAKETAPEQTASPEEIAEYQTSPADATASANAETSENILHDAALPADLLATVPEVKKNYYKPVYTFESTGDWKNFVIKKDRGAIGKIPNTPAFASMPIEPTVLYQTKNNVYVYSDDGYTYQINVATNAITDITYLDDFDFAAVSPNERVVAWVGNDELTGDSSIHLTAIGSSWVDQLTAPSKYPQVGAISFSPRGDAIAVSATAVGDYVVNGALYMYDLRTGQKKLVATTKLPNSYFTIDGWAGDYTPIYHESQMGDDYMVTPGDIEAASE